MSHTPSGREIKSPVEYKTVRTSSNNDTPPEEDSPLFDSEVKKKHFELKPQKMNQDDLEDDIVIKVNYSNAQTSYYPEDVTTLVNQEEELTKEYDRRSFGRRIFDSILNRKHYFGRTAFINGATLPPRTTFPANTVRNQKYTILTFLPLVLFEQFRFFFNLYFLLVALSQFIPQLQVGFLFTYIAPLVFVLSVTIIKEAYDDIKRWRRDVEANSQRYKKLTPDGLIAIPSSDIKVGDLIQISVDQRVPADGILLRTTEKSGASFIRTDQLDGETDWKLRYAVPSCQKAVTDQDLFNIVAAIYAEKPRKEIYDFIGNFTRYGSDGSQDGVESLGLENTLWANCVVASGTVICMIIYTGTETRSVMNASTVRGKVGKLDKELNDLSKFLFLMMLLLSFVMVALKQFQGQWYLTMFRFLLLFSSIIPISMRVNLDMGKTMYSFFMMRDKKIPGTVVRNSSIPEELGRIDYLFTDKTGTLTQNEMVFKKLHLGSISFNRDTLQDINDYMLAAYRPNQSLLPAERQVREALEVLALCHNVTPVLEHDQKAYQASSPDEIALVKFAESVGLILEDRSLTTITLRTPTGELEYHEILMIFPFTSASKRMGIILQNKRDGQINLYMKGADVIMSRLVRTSDWLAEECDNLAREGLRTLVFAKKTITQSEYEDFNAQYNAAKTTLTDRQANVERVRSSIEYDMTLIGVTGVEDLLQQHVQISLENLRNGGIKVWMLTGDKVETAICIARSTRLVNRTQTMFVCVSDDVSEVEQKLAEFEAISSEAALVVDGDTLTICFERLADRFINVACKAPAVVCSRCAPTQKAAIVKLVKKHTKKQTCAIGDGGNDVNMIQSADIGLGIVGKEGRQASLAADFSIMQFSHCQQLILWHGRNSYKRSARLSQFIIHRGLIISVIQAVFSAIFFFATLPVFTGWLMVGYTTFYTMLPVFSIVLDEDVKEQIVFTFPELYRELQKGRALSVKTFLAWCFKAVYQGGIIMLLAIFLFENSFIRIQSIAFTALVMTELLMVIVEVHKLKILMFASIILSLAIYIGSIFVLPGYFDVPFILTFDFWWKVVVITLASCLPISIIKVAQRYINPPSYSKLS
ncbi:phospholipid-transporting ATPase IIB [Acrasis kona]|uniref:Phospholipid-transporting ATPase n=1 Tax=Acrasis kona TaxID=1008807 RepID=A0AAW2YYD3_9EUKA